ncbi:MAG: hypothetical protein ACNYPF_01750 [Candidatus Puniceispirillales bacterium WSBS_2018_MAG_OTU23]
MEVSFSAVADAVFSRYERRWKSSTMRVNRYYLKNQLLPFFGGKNIASITRADVEIWFAGLSHITGPWILFLRGEGLGAVSITS